MEMKDGNNYSGTILIRYKYIKVNLIPSSNFSIGDTVIVKVLAEDLLGNLLETEYSFYIESDLGFGDSILGFSSFGGI